MATYYARNVTGNWASNTSWDSASSGGAGPAGPPVAGDTAIFDSGFTGTITTAASAACATLTCQAGATGTLALGTNTLTMTANPTFVSGFHITGTTGKLSLGGTITITSGGLSIPNLTITSSATYTLADALSVAGLLSLNAGSPVFAGAFDISCDSFIWTGGGTAQFVSSQTITIATAITTLGSSVVASTWRSTTASTASNLVFNGAASACKVASITFTDIAYSGATVTNLDNWYGGTLTRVGNTTFTVTNPTTNPTAGAVYKDSNDVNYTVDAECTATTLTTTCQTSAQPPASGTLTKVSGTGDASIDYSAYTRQGIVNRTSADLPTDAAIAAAVWAYASRTLTA